MVLVSERDEVVPPAMGKEIFGALRVFGDTRESGEGVGGKILGRFVVVSGALHEDPWWYREWTRSIPVRPHTPGGV
jgi:uncharacterized protein